jgi:hypothetical protein
MRVVMGECRVTARQSSAADCRSWVDRYRKPTSAQSSFPLAAAQNRTSPKVPKLGCDRSVPQESDPASSASRRQRAAAGTLIAAGARQPGNCRR